MWTTYLRVLRPDTQRRCRAGSGEHRQPASACQDGLPSVRKLRPSLSHLGFRAGKRSQERGHHLADPNQVSYFASRLRRHGFRVGRALPGRKGDVGVLCLPPGFPTVPHYLARGPSCGPAPLRTGQAAFPAPQSAIQRASALRKGFRSTRICTRGQATARNPLSLFNLYWGLTQGPPPLSLEQPAVVETSCSAGSVKAPRRWAVFCP
jgi:hypothetical protein